MSQKFAALSDLVIADAYSQRVKNWLQKQSSSIQ